MHVRDEHLANQTAKRVKREFGLAREEHLAKIQQASVPTVISPALESPAPAESITPAISSEADTEDDIEDEFHEITAGMEAMADDDDDVELDLLGFLSQLSIPLESLFEFTSLSWIDVHNISAVRSLAEELEFYELADEDGDGGAGIDVAVDEIELVHRALKSTKGCVTQN
ncbi:hypothetical protein BT96DRAFT_947352 [Gymnopus androsaceus JB14]|uniref:Uncharacterized protein n=1 Tax=Gymnopus androsaceus JB14 TaxID=1447944 RepID=A0A6A4GUJ1_9AGAR|nr:hypothetical protein BT96DRAFT_947352 [Gymnopus androsaceus JB14]